MLMPYTLEVAPKGVIHLGANTGEEAELYTARPSIQRVLWVDCNKRTLPYLHMHVDSLPGHMVAEAAVWNKDDEELTFHVTNNDCSSSLLTLDKHKNFYPQVVEDKSHAVKTVTVDTLLKRLELNPQDFDFANLDLQGTELKALEGMVNTLKHIKWVYTEVNFDKLYTDCCLIAELDNFLASFGFKRTLIADTGMQWGDAFYEKQTS
jgi:FkbM family methyltransferase